MVISIYPLWPWPFDHENQLLIPSSVCHMWSKYLYYIHEVINICPLWPWPQNGFHSLIMTNMCGKCNEEAKQPFNLYCFHKVTDRTTRSRVATSINENELLKMIETKSPFWSKLALVSTLRMIFIIFYYTMLININVLRQSLQMKIFMSDSSFVYCSIVSKMVCRFLMTFYQNIIRISWKIIFVIKHWPRSWTSPLKVV